MDLMNKMIITNVLFFVLSMIVLKLDFEIEEIENCASFFATLNLCSFFVLALIKIWMS